MCKQVRSKSRVMRYRLFSLTFICVCFCVCSGLQAVAQTRAGQGWNSAQRVGERRALIAAVDNSLRYLGTRRAASAYRRYAASGVTRAHVQRSLLRFRQLVRASRSAEQLQAAVTREFVWHWPLGGNSSAGRFTGYFQPFYRASRVRTTTYRYPLYRLPVGFARWRVHPTRAQLEGADGSGDRTGRLRPLVWLADRMEAYLVHVQGSARLQLPNGRAMTIGFAGKTAHPYTSIGRQLVSDGIMSFEELTMPAMLRYFQAHPEQVNHYLPRNRSFVFFRETHGRPPSGSVGVPLTAGRSIATDKAHMPPGALAFIQMRFANPEAVRALGSGVVRRYVLDQDVGSAIKGPGRVDVFMGTGARAGLQAGVINAPGQVYLLLLKKD